MATVGDLMHIQATTIQILASGAEQPTVSEVAERAEAEEIVPYLIELGTAAGVDVSLLSHFLAPETADGRAVAQCIASAANAIDTDRKYGMPYDERLGLLALLWWCVDQTPQAAREVDLGW